jgi:hypothetical protein
MLHGLARPTRPPIADVVTSEEWENLSKAVESESGEKIEWRKHDEILDAEDRATQKA